MNLRVEHLGSGELLFGECAVTDLRNVALVRHDAGAARVDQLQKGLSSSNLSNLT